MRQRHRLSQPQLTFYAVLNDNSYMGQLDRRTDRQADRQRDGEANRKLRRFTKIIMLNLTGNSTQGHLRMRPRRRQLVDDGVADCWLN